MLDATTSSRQNKGEIIIRNANKEAIVSSFKLFSGDLLVHKLCAGVQAEKRRTIFGPSEIAHSNFCLFGRLVQLSIALLLGVMPLPLHVLFLP